ncbi:hypothetical protein [Rhodohalobacter sp. 8-1]|uniref:hypothetical protein n=1 Tax=Rhodohalobacter sp. 8-1 TaxID=3131972 RepID=UPI0030EF02E2
MKHYLIFLIGGCLILWATGCDNPSSPAGTDSAVLSSLSIQPNSVQFGPQSSITDTTLTVQIRANTTESPANDLVYTIERDGELVKEGTLQPESDTIFLAEYSLEVNTARNANITIYIYEADNSSGQRLQGKLQVRGRIVSPPVIEEVSNTEEAVIPDSGNQRIDFFARVVHPNGQDLIDRVNFFLIDQSGNQLGDDFRMFDNGVFNEVEGFIDEAEGDSLYSRAFFTNPNNNPDEITVNYYAIGADGQSSDTLQTQLSIIE